MQEIINRSKERSFYFSIDSNGEPTTETYSENGKNPELFIEQRPDHSLTKIHIDGMTDTHPHINKVLRFMLTINPDFKNSQLRFDNNNPITLSQFLEKNKDLETNEIPEYLFHGTSIASAMKILKEGLMPRDITGQTPKYTSTQTNNGDNDKVYLCGINTIGSAKFAASQAASKDNSKPVILKIKTSNLDDTLLGPDEDSKSSSWQDSINAIGSLSYKGVIEPSCIVVDKNLTKKLSVNIDSDSNLSI